MNQSIYPVRSQVLHNLFNEIEHRKIMVVPIDFAKDIHEAQLCRGTGQYLLHKPLRVHNSLKGLAFLQAKLKKSCRRYGIKKSSVVICGEDPCSFSTNFIHGLKLRGYTFIRVNAKEASKLRLSSRASTNELDLNGIAQAAIHRRGYETIDYTSVYTSLKESTRSRRRLVRQMTMLKNQIHSLIDVLFPGFLSKTKMNLEPFCDASLALMEDNFSAIKIQHMRVGRLQNILKKNRIRNPEGIADKLKELCSQAAPPPSELAAIMNKTLTAYIQLLRQQMKSIKDLEHCCAQLLIQTPCFILVTIPRVGYVTAAEIAGELGDPKNWKPAMEIASYAGIVSRIKNTGHPDNEATVLNLPRDCNHRLKNAFIWIAKHVGRYAHPIRRESTVHDGSHVLQTHFLKKEAANGRSILSTAKKLVRITCAMTKQQVPYLPTSPKPKDLDEAAEFMQIEMNCAIKVLEKAFKQVDLTVIPKNRNRMQEWIDITRNDFKQDIKHK